MLAKGSWPVAAHCPPSPSGFGAAAFAYFIPWWESRSTLSLRSSYAGHAPTWWSPRGCATR